MASIKPSVPKGTRDFSPAEMAKRNYIFDTIKSVFRKYGYQQIETPAMENLSTLMGKYGEEGDKLIFKILNSGDFLSKVDQQLLTTYNLQRITSEISEKAGTRQQIAQPLVPQAKTAFCKSRAGNSLTQRTPLSTSSTEEWTQIT